MASLRSVCRRTAASGRPALANALHLVPDPRSLAQAIIDTVRAPLLVLDEDLCVIAASRSYYAIFRTDEQAALGRSLYDLAAAQWDVPDLRGLLDKVVKDRATIEAYEIQIVVPEIGTRTLLLDARTVFYADHRSTSFLLGFEDVTELRAAKRLADEAMLQKTMLLQEMRHRVANSLQIIASILMLKARAVASEEIRDHLKDAHRRVMSVATVQAHLQAIAWGDDVEIGPYLTTLCEGLVRSMIHDTRPVALSVRAGAGAASSAQAVSLGLIVTELVINALKYAFPDGQGGEVMVDYGADAGGWRLSVSDNGRGMKTGAAPVGGGLGSRLIDALAAQLRGRIERSDLKPGLRVSIISDEPHAVADEAIALELARPGDFLAVAG
jgi:chemotaxis protein methyltransferase CheR